MLVMDYPREVDIISTKTDTQDETSWAIEIPPFHTGHLGFLPETKVQVTLMRGADETREFHPDEVTFCELLVTPFARKVGELVRIECSMIDCPGVVQSLIAAVSSLHVNIVTIETTIDDHPPQHQIAMIVDLSPARIGEQDPIGKIPDEYRKYSRNVPLDDPALIQIFERIADKCGGVLAWKRESDGKRPRIRIRRIHTRRGVEEDDWAPICRCPKPTHYRVRIAAPHRIGKLVANRLNIKDIRNLSYFLVSETEERVLRAYFFRNNVRPKLLHIGYYHYDSPGALSAILKLLARAHFNIITSLLRKESERESVWEAVLEYRGNEELPPSGSGPEAQIKWAAQKLLNQAEPNDLENLEKFEAALGLPRYPKPSGTTRRHRLFVRGNESRNSAMQPSHPPPSHPPSRTDRWKDDRRRLSEALRRRQNPTARVVFVSFPMAAQEHATAVKKALRAQGLETTDGMEQKGQPILDEIVQKIRDADYFLGIWHYEQNGPQVEYGVSPWLPFELGVAMAQKKPRLVVRHQKIPLHIWNRIDPDRNKPKYTDFNFESKTIPLIISKISQFFTGDEDDGY